MSKQFLSVGAVDLTADEVRDLRRHLGLRDTASTDHIILTKVLIVPFAGAIDKEAVDVPVDQVKKWLDRPEVQDRTVETFGHVRIVKVGKEIRTEN